MNWNTQFLALATLPLVILGQEAVGASELTGKRLSFIPFFFRLQQTIAVRTPNPTNGCQITKNPNIS
jgi:hypothetical protein